jgi:hypothetical protein
MLCFLGQFSIVGGDCAEQVIERGCSLDQALAQVVVKASDKVTRVIISACSRARASSGVVVGMLDGMA